MLMRSLGEQMHSIATSPRERALAALRLVGAFDGIGQYAPAMEWIQTAVREPGLPDDARRLLRANLANAHYSLCNLVEAGAVAKEVIEEFESYAPLTRADRAAQVLAWYVLGHSHRRAMADDAASRPALAAKALQPLTTAATLADSMGREFGDPSYLGIANTCRGGVIEAEVEGGRRPAMDGLREVVDRLAEVVDVATAPKGDLLESWGWWAVFGCNIAQRHLVGDEQERFLAILTNKASEIAERQGKWCMQEQIFSIEFLRRFGENAIEGHDPWLFDIDDLRTLIGAMGRFRHFRAIGWAILARARIVGWQGGLT